MKKMRLLTFMQIAETKKEISFETIMQELQLEEESVESFVIDGESFKVNAEHRSMIAIMFQY